MLRQTFVRVDLSAFRRNVEAARRLLGPRVKLLAVVKADGYGHGIEAVGLAAEQAGADYLGVALAEEGLALREAGVRLPILCFAALNQAGYDALAREDISAAIPSLDCLHMADLAAGKAGKPLRLHLKLETGMNRIGIAGEEELRQTLDIIARHPLLALEGAFTHFAWADPAGGEYTRSQGERFRRLASLLPEGLILHAGATGGALFFPEYRLNMVRLGIALYGYAPKGSALAVEPCLSLLSEVTFVKRVEEGAFISYGCTYRAERPMTVATVAIGYADGYRRELGNRARVLIRGVPCPVVGRVCMDQLMVDASAVPDAAPGDEVTLIGAQGGERIGADELAALCGTIPYEILTSVGKRVPRVYLSGKGEA